MLEKCPSLDLSNTNIITRGCDLTRQIHSGKVCHLICSTAPFENLYLSQVTIHCIEGTWQQLRSDIERYFPFDFHSLRCSGRPRVAIAGFGKSCCGLPYLEHGKFTGNGCVEQAAHGERCSFSCSEHLTASPTNTEECPVEEGVIECLNGQWQQPFCIDPQTTREVSCAQTKISPCAIQKEVQCSGKKVSACETAKNNVVALNRQCAAKKICNAKKVQSICQAKKMKSGLN
ncbi:hypothetical protein MHBO_000552 [Bonamia ostreae]|uniref:Uncharacterized protein n=1 Tax=Bonamia ostreae TaxID=126728 RepID=A0ABV2AGT8_9EUKA